MPFYCGKRSAGICVVVGPKNALTYSLGNEGVLARLRWVSVIGLRGMTLIAAGSTMVLSLLFLIGGMPMYVTAVQSTGEGARSTETAAVPFLDRLSDITNRMAVSVTLVGRDSFKNEFRYDVSVKNQSSDTFNTDDVVLVLDRITDLAGKDALDRLEVVSPDGETTDGKAYFRIPRGGAGKLSPYADSLPAVVRVRNLAYTAVFTPSFRVFGLLQKSGKPQVELADLLQLLIKKGIVTEDELRSLKVR